MNTYKRHRFPPEIISYAVWLYYRFNLSHRDIEDLLAERGITVSSRIDPTLVHQVRSNLRPEIEEKASWLRRHVLHRWSFH